MVRIHRLGVVGVTLLGWLAAASVGATPEQGEPEPRDVAPESISEVMLEDTVLELEDAHVLDDAYESVATTSEPSASENPPPMPAKVAPSP